MLREGVGLLQCLPCFRNGLCGHRRIDVRTERQCHPPVADATRGIEPRGFSKRAHRLCVVESVAQNQSLIEEPLGLLGIGGDGEVMIADAVEQGSERFFGDGCNLSG